MVDNGIRRILLNRFKEVKQRFLITALRKMYKPEELQRIKIISLLNQNLLIKKSSLIKFFLLMRRDSLSQ
jgi:hypothetical protein